MSNTTSIFTRPQSIRMHLATQVCEAIAFLIDEPVDTLMEETIEEQREWKKCSASVNGTEIRIEGSPRAVLNIFMHGFAIVWGSPHWPILNMRIAPSLFTEGQEVRVVLVVEMP